ncbi:hypothetical protein HDA32_000625 [Spinactinospora alkalitolerans]|uniref:Uncharacterized protein n=1 Tax=Spinactinospora alkalitolerans TaxID=687207 RepID=A0A852TPG7_9ACTN|nr:hypothetical protein [Spinactinospora alkalitolerans]NYE45505.1 hypothetical protein [Spinactinospora alkalitolerans]
MSSSPLYVAIVVVWAIVLIPMLLRRDAADPAPNPFRRSAPGDAGVDDADDAPEFDDEYEPDEDHGDPDGESADDVRTQVLSYGSGPVPAAHRALARHEAEEPAGDAEDAAEAAAPRPEPAPPPAGAPPMRVGRARVIARRRRRTSGLTALLTATSVAVAAGLGPWWVLVPPAVLLMGHLVLLREAAKADQERRAAEAEHRRREERARARRAAAEAAREAEVIELTTRRDQVYDQYADAHLRAAGD